MPFRERFVFSKRGIRIRRIRRRIHQRGHQRRLVFFRGVVQRGVFVFLHWLGRPCGRRTLRPMRRPGVSFREHRLPARVLMHARVHERRRVRRRGHLPRDVVVVRASVPRRVCRTADVRGLLRDGRTVLRVAVLIFGGVRHGRSNFRALRSICRCAIQARREPWGPRGV